MDPAAAPAGKDDRGLGQLFVFTAFVQIDTNADANVVALPSDDGRVGIAWQANWKHFRGADWRG